MKKQTKTYLLLGLVLCIWGAIAVQFFGGINKEELLIEKNQKVNFIPIPKQDRDTFSILADYRDPFLGTFQKKKASIKREQRPPKTAEPEVLIEYTGLVMDADAKNQIFFMSIDGEQLLMKKGQKLKAVTLISGTKDKVKIRYKRKIKTIPVKGS